MDDFYVSFKIKTEFWGDNLYIDRVKRELVNIAKENINLKHYKYQFKEISPELNQIIGTPLEDNYGIILIYCKPR